MCINGKIPFDYNYFTLVPGALFWEFLTWAIMQEVKYWSIVEGKRPKEISILRSQQMYFVTTPLHGVATYDGLISGYNILKSGLDASMWNSFKAPAGSDKSWRRFIPRLPTEPVEWVENWLKFLVLVEVTNVVAAIVGVGLVGLDGDFTPYLVGAITSSLFLALVFDPFCILIMGSPKTITMKHAYLLFWIVMIAFGLFTSVGLGKKLSKL